MTPTDLRAAFIADLTAVAPDIDPESIGDNDHMQDDLGLDSMDFLNLVSALHKRFGLPIPEADYPQLATEKGGERTPGLTQCQLLPMARADVRLEKKVRVLGLQSLALRMAPWAHAIFPRLGERISAVQSTRTADANCAEIPMSSSAWCFL
jgi:acyl carrier protein